MYTPDDTIVAIASAPGGAARGILRLSGPDVPRCVAAVFLADPPVDLQRIRRATVLPGTADLGRTSAWLPCELYSWPGPRSYTGEPVAEIHTLGCRPLLELLLGRLCSAGARLAAPGEFTLRAFLAGRIDLVQAEAVLGVIDAVDSGELDVALSQLAGGLAAPLAALRDRLIDLLAHLEAGFDFADEDLAWITPNELLDQLTTASQTVADLLRQLDCRADSSSLVRAVLIGAPNVGKSSLFNVLAGKSGALVSHLPGTTRDYLTAELDLDGVRCLLVDTAGLDLALPVLCAGRAERRHPERGEGSALPAREQVLRWPQNAMAPDRLAQTVSSQQGQQAHLQILCLDATRPLDAWEAAELADDSKRRIVVLTKADAAGQLPSVPEAIATSSVTGQGMETLRAELARAVLSSLGGGAGAVAGTAIRCRESLRLASESLACARRIVQQRGGEELVATEVRVGLEELGKVVGAVYTDDILDRIFSRFCVGK